MKKSKIIALALALVFILALFAGCGDSGSENPTEAPAKTEAPQAGEEPEQPADGEEPSDSKYPLTTDDVTLSFFYQTDSSTMGMSFDISQNKAYKEAGEITGINLEFMPVSNSAFTDQFNVLLASNTLPDIVSDFTVAYTNSIDYAVEEELVVDLEQYSDLCPNYMGYLESNTAFNNDAHTDSGYLPIFYRLQDYTRIRQGMVIRQDWLDKLNLETPVTYDDVHDVLTAFHNEYGASLHLYQDVSTEFSDGYNALFSFWNTFMPFYQVDGVVKYGLIEDSYKDYLTMLAQWYSEGLIHPMGIYDDQHTLFSFNDDSKYVVNNEVGIFRTYADQFNGFKDLSDDPDFELAGLATPVLKEGDTVKVTSGYILSGASVSSSLPTVINAESDYIELAIQYMDFFYSEDGIRLVSYGTEGETCTKNPDGTYSLNELILANSDGLTTEQAAKLYMCYLIPSYTDPAIFDDALDPAALECYDIWLSNRSTEYMLPTTVTLTADETDSVNTVMGDAMTYASENILAFVTGEKPISEFDSFVATLKEMGIDQCIADYQTAYDRYLAR